MTATTVAAGDRTEHLDDAALVRALDGEPIAGDDDAAASVAAAAHLAACAPCAARAERLRARRAQLSALLVATDAPVPAMRPVVLRSAPPRRRVMRPPARPFARPAVRLAAAGVLVAAAGLAAQPVRRWMAAHWAHPASGRLPARGAPHAATTDTTRAAGAGSVVVSFTPEPGPFTLRFDARPAGGTLTVHVAAHVAAGSRVTATASPGAGGRAGDFVVLPAGLRVRNAAAPRGDYDVTLPAGTARLRVSFDAPAADTVLPLLGPTPVALPLRAP